MQVSHTCKFSGKFFIDEEIIYIRLNFFRKKIACHFETLKLIK
jgi:hypothetical protein